MTVSVSEAASNLTDLIDRALSGEGIVVTRSGKPVVEIRAVKREVRPITQADVDWLKDNALVPRQQRDSGVQVSEMRDEEWVR